MASTLECGSLVATAAREGIVSYKEKCSENDEDEADEPFLLWNEWFLLLVKTIPVALFTKFMQSSGGQIGQ